MIQNGENAVLGSDLVVAQDPNVFPTLSFLIGRPKPRTSITIEQLLVMLTKNGMWAIGLENMAGNITVGKYTDFAVLDRIILEITPKEIADTKVMLTVFEGSVVNTLDLSIVPKSKEKIVFKGYDI